MSSILTLKSPNIIGYILGRGGLHSERVALDLGGLRYWVSVASVRENQTLLHSQFCALQERRGCDSQASITEEVNALGRRVVGVECVNHRIITFWTDSENAELFSEFVKLFKQAKRVVVEFGIVRIVEFERTKRSQASVVFVFNTHKSMITLGICNSNSTIVLILASTLVLVAHRRVALTLGAPITIT
jgi:hypothetical protein